MRLTDCYLCGNPITEDDRVTSDHVVPVGLLNRKQPKERGYDYAGRIRTHQECNNHFSDETFLKQAMHLAELILTKKASVALHNADHPEITVLPITPDQITKFVGRDFKRFNFIDARQLSLEQLGNPEIYQDARKTNLSQTAMYIAMSVVAKSAAALLIKRRLHSVPKTWRIYATPYEAMNFSDFKNRFGDTTPFDAHTWAAVHKTVEDEWVVAYQHKSLLFLLLFVLHPSPIDLVKIFTTPGSEIHHFSGNSLNELLARQWQFLLRIGSLPPS